MKLKKKDLEQIHSKILNDNPTIYENGHYLKKLINSSINMDNLFYTLEYNDILTQSYKKDNKYSKQLIEYEKLKMLLNIMKNKAINYDEEYFNLIFKLYTKINNLIFDGENFKITEYKNQYLDLNAYNNLLLFFSFNYNNYFINNFDQYYLLSFINLFESQMMTIINATRFEEVTTIINDLKKYNPFLVNTILNNINYLNEFSKEKELIFRYLYNKYNIADSSMDLYLQYKEYMMIYIIEYFIKNYKSYNYDIITKILTLIDNNKYDYTILNEENIIHIIDNEFEKEKKYTKSLN